MQFTFTSAGTGSTTIVAVFFDRAGGNDNDNYFIE